MIQKLGDDQQLDQAVYLWYEQKRMEGVLVSKLILCENVVEFSKILNGEGANFYTIEGWKW